MYSDGSAKRPNLGHLLVHAAATSTTPTIRRHDSGWMTAQAMRAPLPPLPTSVTWSSGLAWMMNALPSASNSVAAPSVRVTRSVLALRRPRPSALTIEVRQVAGVRPARVVQTVLVSQRVVVAARGGEGRRARSDGVDVDAVQAGRQALDLDVDVDDRRADPRSDGASPTVAPDASTKVAARRGARRPGRRRRSSPARARVRDPPRWRLVRRMDDMADLPVEIAIYRRCDISSHDIYAAGACQARRRSIATGRLQSAR